jgi:hypothetical protein
VGPARRQQPFVQRRKAYRAETGWCAEAACMPAGSRGLRCVFVLSRPALLAFHGATTPCTPPGCSRPATSARHAARYTADAAEWLCEEIVASFTTCKGTNVHGARSQATLRLTKCSRFDCSNKKKARKTNWGESGKGALRSRRALLCRGRGVQRLHHADVARDEAPSAVGGVHAVLARAECGIQASQRRVRAWGK